MLNFIYRRGLKSANVEYINALASFKVLGGREEGRKGGREGEREEGREGGRAGERTTSSYQKRGFSVRVLALVMTPRYMPSLPPCLPPSL